MIQLGRLNNLLTNVREIEQQYLYGSLQNVFLDVGAGEHFERTSVRNQVFFDFALLTDR